VSLSGYEELANDEEDTTAMTGVEDSTAHPDESQAGLTPKNRDHDDATMTGDQAGAYRGGDESVLSDGDGSLTGSTPRPPATKSISARPQFAELDSPYEVLKRQMKGDTAGNSGEAAGDEEEDTEVLFQQHTARLPDISLTPGTSRDKDGDDQSRRKNTDRLLHRVLGKNYRIMETPHKDTGVSPLKWRVNAEKKETAASQKAPAVPIWQDSPMSSPEMEVPKMRSAAFASPLRAVYRNKLAAAAGAPRTPGVSVQTPATAGKKMRDVYRGTPRAEKEAEEINWESDEDDDDIYGGMSPPKTINFALPPSKLLQTPGKLCPSYVPCKVSFG
jgi:DASH complex subunit ASK1